MKFCSTLAFAVSFVHVVRADPVDLEQDSWLRGGDKSSNGDVSVKIVGGSEVPASNDAYRFVTSLQRKSGSKYIHHCGGSLIDELHVLTAAHCVKTTTPARVQIGEYDLSKTSGGQIRNVKSVSRHPANGILTNDVAVLTLDRAVTDIAPVTVSNAYIKGMEGTGTMLTVIGWGATVEGGAIVTKLRQVNVPVVDQNKCKNQYYAVTSTNICAGYDKGLQDSCGGDSGGPLFFTGSDGKITQIGVVSYGTGCARPMKYGVYARVSASYLYDFISAQSDISEGPRPTKAPTMRPTKKPTPAPTMRPTKQPTMFPTRYPTKAPTMRPTKRPTLAPTVRPTKAPTMFPTRYPTKAPTNRPTRATSG